MATIKCTALFQLATNVSDPNNPQRRIGGWSESWYSVGTIGDAISRFQTGGASYCALRAPLLPIGAQIVGQRFQPVNPTGTSQTNSQKFPGSSGHGADVPQMALLCRVAGSNVINTRSMILRGIPDARVVEGEFVPSVAFQKALDRFFANGLSFLSFRGQDLTLPKVPVVDTTTLNVVNTVTPHGFVVGDIVHIARTKLVPSEVKANATVRVVLVTTTLQFTTTEQGFGSSQGGYVRKVSVIYPTVDTTNVQVSRIITRRVGRPFEQFRGRRSKRNNKLPLA